VKIFITNQLTNTIQAGLKNLQFGNLMVSHNPNANLVMVDSRVSIMYFGNILGIKTSETEIIPFSVKLLKKMVLTNSQEKIRANLEGRYVMLIFDKSANTIAVFNDQYAQYDLYYYQNNNEFIIADDLRFVNKSNIKLEHDQDGLAYALTVYGYRPPKKHTLYKDIKRVGVDETIQLMGSKLEVIDVVFEPLKTEPYEKKELDTYTDIFLDAVKLRGSENGNIVYLSSGWDSTAILAALVHLYGKDKVRAVTGRMIYAERSGVINPFEIERAQAVADYYGVELETVDFDYRNKVPGVIDDMKQDLRANFISSGNIFSHGILAEHIAKIRKNNESVFVGEISDGIHNLGFSQYVTIFHPDIKFREYSDKMASYLYGPTFLDTFLDNSFDSDVIYKLLRSQAEMSGTNFEEPVSDGKEDRIVQLLSGFFLNSKRLPLIAFGNNSLLTEYGSKHFRKHFEDEYLRSVTESYNADTVYSWLIHLYSSFHWQGSTVATLPLSADVYGFEIQLPFYDSRLVAFLSKMPESWGRGLDLNPTKYPLKAMLEKRIDYPMHLQVGPHSYLYDVDHSFNHSTEVAYGSAFKDYFKQILAESDILTILSPEYFNHAYITNIIEGYISGDEVSGADLSNLLAISRLAMVGWYS
jgi:hypothetical protein